MARNVMYRTITIVVNVISKQKHKVQVQSLLKKLSRETQMEEGNIFYIVHKSKKKQNEFIIYEKWKNKAALNTHMKSSHLENFFNECIPLLKNKILGTICSEI